MTMITKMINASKELLRRPIIGKVLLLTSTLATSSAACFGAASAMQYVGAGRTLTGVAALVTGGVVALGNIIAVSSLQDTAAEKQKNARDYEHAAAFVHNHRDEMQAGRCAEAAVFALGALVISGGNPIVAAIGAGVGYAAHIVAEKLTPDAYTKGRTPQRTTATSQVSRSHNQHKL